MFQRDTNKTYAAFIIATLAVAAISALILANSDLSYLIFAPIVCIPLIGAITLAYRERDWLGLVVWIFFAICVVGRAVRDILGF